jgi:ribonuclease D
VPDSALVAAARVLPASKRDLVAMREFNGRASRTQIDRWWNAIQAGLATTDLPTLRQQTESIPPPRAWSDKNPEADRRLKAARTALAAVSGELNIPVENVLTPEVLRRLAWSPPDPIELDAVREALVDLGARPWQIDAIAQPITSAFVDSVAFVDASQTTAETDEADS